MIDRRGIGVLVLLGAVFLVQLGLRPALYVDETRYLSVAWEMRVSGDWFHLTRNFESYAHKPPLLFWLINLFWMALGVTEFAGRLVGPVAALLAVLLTWRLAERLFPGVEGIGWRAMAVLAGTTVLVLYGGATMFDALLTIPVLLGLGVLWRIGHGAEGRGVWVLFGLCLGLGVYAKGPVIALHLLPALALIRLWAPTPPGWREVAGGLGLALAVALGMVALWLVPALITGDAAFRQEILWEQTADRVTGTLGHGRPFWFLLALLPVILFPFGWSIGLWRRIGAAAWADAGGRLCTIWALSAVVLFSIVGGKQLHYLIPELAAFAILAARAMAAEGRGWTLAPVFPGLIGLGLIGVASGLIPLDADAAALLTPTWAVALAGVVFLGLAVAPWRLPMIAGHALAGAGLALGLHGLVAVTGLAANFRPDAMAARVAEAMPRGVAFVGIPYNAEYQFPGRLTAGLATPVDADALQAWIAAHPEGLVIGPIDRVEFTTEPAAVEEYAFRRYGIWTAASLISRE